jgi:hypothetical protein
MHKIWARQSHNGLWLLFYGAFRGFKEIQSLYLLLYDVNSQGWMYPHRQKFSMILSGPRSIQSCLQKTMIWEQRKNYPNTCLWSILLSQPGWAKWGEVSVGLHLDVETSCIQPTHFLHLMEPAIFKLVLYTDKGYNISLESIHQYTGSMEWACVCQGSHFNKVYMANHIVAWGPWLLLRS